MELAADQITSLVDQARSGDTDAFGQIVSQYQGLVSSVTYSVTGDVDHSQDLAQETFITAWKHLRELRDIQKLPAWLCGIARNLARNSRRAQLKDPLSCAGEVSPEHAVQQESTAERLSRTEREAILWQTLADIPEDYREPLVLYYREGQSVRAVALALDISEESARQRLSRGRKMLREQVAAIIEDTLRITRPGSAFTIAVLGALTVAAGQTATAGVITTGTVTAGKATGAGTAAAVSSGTMASVAGGLLGGFAGGFAGGFFGARAIRRMLWTPIQNSSSLRARRFAVKMRAVLYASYWLFIGYIAAAALLFLNAPISGKARGALGLGALAVGVALYLPYLIALIVWASRAARRIIDEDTGVCGAPKCSPERSSQSLASVRNAGYFSLVLAVLGSVPIVVWLAQIWSRPLWLAAALLILLVHAGFLALYRKLTVAVADEQAFAITG